jgi:hypothetical protein
MSESYSSSSFSIGDGGLLGWKREWKSNRREVRLVPTIRKTAEDDDDEDEKDSDVTVNRHRLGRR